MGARLKSWRRSRVPEKRSRYEAVDISRGFAARDGSAVKSHSTILQRLRRQISLDYYTIPPATQATTTMFTYSHANTPLGQSERAYYLSYLYYISQPEL